MKYLYYLLLVTLFFFPLHAKEYPKLLDTRYSDHNKNLIADTPKDPTHWIDPPTLVFSYAPHEDPNIYQKDWKDFLAYLSQVTEKEVIYFPYQTNIAQLEAMRYGRLHISGFNTGLVPTAVNYAGFHPIAIMADKHGKYGYTMEIITYPGSGIEQVDDIRDTTLVLTAPSSNSGNKAPRYLLQKQFGMQAKEDYCIQYSGSHARSIRGVMKRQYGAAAVASSVLNRMILRGEVDPSKIKVLYRSEPFPTTAYGYVYNLKPALAKKIEKAFLTFPWKKESGQEGSLKKAFHRHDKFMPLNYRKMWRTVREMQQNLYDASER